MNWKMGVYTRPSHSTLLPDPTNTFVDKKSNHLKKFRRKPFQMIADYYYNQGGLNLEWDIHQAHIGECQVVKQCM